MNDKIINGLIKDIKNYTGISYEKEIDYITTCLKVAYWKGRVDSTKGFEKIQKKYKP